MAQASCGTGNFAANASAVDDQDCQVGQGGALEVAPFDGTKPRYLLANAEDL